MSANHCEEKLLEFAYGELSPAEANAVEVHLSSCAQCSGAFKSIRQVRQAMSQLPLAEPSSTGLDSLLSYAQQAARRAQAGPSRSSGWKRWLFPSAGVVAVAVVVVVSAQVLRVVELAPAPRASQTLQVQAPTSQNGAATDEIAQKPSEEPQYVSPQSPSPAKDAPSSGKGQDDAFGRAQREAPKALAHASARDELKAMAKQKTDSKRAGPPTQLPNNVSKEGVAGGAVAGVLREQADRSNSVQALGGLGTPAQPAAAAEPARLAGKLRHSEFTGVSGDRPGAARWDAEAEQAKLAGDRTREVGLLRQVLASSPQGTTRANLLSRLCDALDSIGNTAEADSVCEQLIREFPASQEAQTALQRKANRGAEPPAAPSRAKPKKKDE